MIFLVILGKMAFLFPENMILFLGRKMKDDLSGKKNTWKYDILFKCPEEMVFSKRLRWNMIFLVLSGKMVFFSQKHDIFSLEGKRTIIFLKNYIEKLYFLYIRVTNTMLCPSAKKKEEKRSFSAKIHLKVIDILD